jgi:hypothetical protein
MRSDRLWTKEINAAQPNLDAGAPLGSGKNNAWG